MRGLVPKGSPAETSQSLDVSRLGFSKAQSRKSFETRYSRTINGAESASAAVPGWGRERKMKRRRKRKGRNVALASEGRGWLCGSVWRGLSGDMAVQQLSVVFKPDSVIDGIGHKCGEAACARGCRARTVGLMGRRCGPSYRN